MNSVDQAAAILTGFLSNERLHTMALKGAWGVGKSYFIRDFLKQPHGIIPPFVSYVSLFGLSTIEDVRTAIVDRLEYDETKLPKAVLATIKAGKGLKVNLGIVSYEVPNLGNALFWHIARQNTVLVIFDDLERRNEQLKLDQVLGLISSIGENSKAKFLIVFNEDNLGSGSKIISHYREKVIDVELTYAPSTEELVSNFLEEKIASEVLVSCLKLSGGPNIRIINHVNRVIIDLRSILSKYQYTIDTDSVISIASTTWLFYVSPLPLTIESFYEATMGFRNNSESDDSEEAQKLASMVSDARLRPTDLDALVIQYLRNGYLSESFLSSFTSNAKKQDEEAEFNARLTEAYKPYVSNFRAGINECAKPIEELLSEYAGKIGIEVMADACRFLELLGRNTGWLWHKHIKNRTGQLSHQTLNSYLSLVKDAETISLIEQQMNSVPEKVDAPTTISKIVEENSWSQNEIKQLNELTSEYYFEWLLTEEGKILRPLRSFLEICSHGREGGEEQKLKKKLVNVMWQLAKKNPATRIRLINYFKLNPEEQEAN